MTRCFEPDEIAAALALPEESAGRRHLDACPRCRNLVLAYYEFREREARGRKDKAPPRDDLRERLEGAFTGRGQVRRPWWRVEWPLWLWVSALVTILAALVLLLGPQRHRDALSPALQGALLGADPRTGMQAEARPEGVAVSWPADPRADKTVVVFYDDRMTELGRIVTSGTRLVVMADDPLARAAACRLLRVAGSDTLGHSAVVVPVREHENRGR